MSIEEEPRKMDGFEETRKKCLDKGVLWEDPEFPASQSSVFYHQTPPFAFEWKRPSVRLSARVLFCGCCCCGCSCVTTVCLLLLLLLPPLRMTNGF